MVLKEAAEARAFLLTKYQFTPTTSTLLIGSILESPSPSRAANMPLPETAVSRLLADYSQDIRLVMQLLEEHFGIPDSIGQWRSKQLDRTGFLDGAKTICYGMHGAGCTVEFKKGKYVSFDLDERGNYCFDPWKFKRYTESVGVDCDSLDDPYIRSLAKQAF
jgi:hypothetical protein